MTFSKVWKIDALNTDLASALAEEGKPLEAVSIYEDKIERLRRDDEIAGRRSHESMNLEAAYFDYVELLYRAANYTEHADKAKNKAVKARAAAARIPETKKRSVLD